MQGFGGSRAPSVGVLPRADSVAASRGGGGGGRFGVQMSRPGTAKLGPVPRRPPSIMPVMRPRSAATGGAAQAAAAGPLPPPGKISAHAFRVEKKGQYQGELNVPSILFIGKAGEPAEQSVAKQKRAELSKYKLRPGALEELDIEEDEVEEEDLDASLPRAGGATSPQKKSVSYDMAPYGGKREMDSLRRQIVETETAALESRMQSQTVVSKTRSTVAMVEEKVGHVRESNQQLDSELVEIEKQIEELKRISRTQIDEIKALRESNKHKETKLHAEQQNLEQYEGTVRDAMLQAQEVQEQEKLTKASVGASRDRDQTGSSVARASSSAAGVLGTGAGAGAGAGTGLGASGGAGASASGAAARVGPSVESGVGEPAYKGDKGERPADHPEIQCLLELGDHLALTDGRIWSQGGERRDQEQHFLALHASEDYVQVPPWLAGSKAPSDWTEDKGSRKLGFQAASLDLPHSDLEMEHVYGYAGSSSVDAICCTASGKLVYPAASLCLIHDVVHSRQRFFSGHADAVLCLAVHPEGQMVASGDVGKSSKVLVWDSEAPEMPPAVSLWGFHQAGVGGLSFSRDGNKLVTVGRDVDHCLCVWDWRKEERLVSCKTGGNPVLAVRFDPVTSDIITAGVRHLKFWTMVGTRMQVSMADFKKKGSLQTFLSIAFMRVRNGKEGVTACTTLTGTQDGSLYLWNTKGEMIANPEKKAHEGPVTILVAPFQGDQECGNHVFSGGADGKVRRWDAHVSTGLSPIWTIDLEEKTRTVFAPFSAKKFPVRGIACKDDRIYVGTCMNEIYQFAVEPAASNKVARAPDVSKVVMHAHTQGTLHALDIHPLRQEFVTVAWDSTLRIWDTEARECRWAVQLLPYDEERVAATAVQYSPDGEHVCVGFENGDVWVLDASAIAAAAPMNWESDKFFVKNSVDDNVKLNTTKGKAISVLRYRPDGVLLVAAGLGGKVTIFLVQDSDASIAYDVIKSFRAHMCNIRSLDFSEDCKLMQSTGVDNQILYWQMEMQASEVNLAAVREVTDASGNVEHGVQDVVWATWTSALGWPVEGIYDVNRHDQHVRTSAFASRDRQLVLAWDDKDVLLYNFPCRRGAAPRRFKGHASVPAQARFLQHDRGVVSIGTTDMCIIQWKPPNIVVSEPKQSDTEVVALINRCSEVREEGLIVRLTLEEDSSVATSSGTAASMWKELSSGLAQLLSSNTSKVGVERLELLRIMAGSLKFEVLLRPHALGWNVSPTASELLSRLEKLYENGLMHRKFPKVLGGVEVVQGPEEPEDDFMGMKPWLGVINPPQDWSSDRGSKLLNYAPTCRLEEFASDQDQQAEPMFIPKPRPPSLIAYEDDPPPTSAEEPGEEQQPASKMLTLDYVHGYQGWGGGGNLFYQDTEHLVYSAGSIGVVHHVPSNTQRFMQGHKDQIASFAKQPVQPGAHGGLAPSTFATGELGKRGSIRVWTAQPGHAPVQTAGLQGFHNCDVVAMCFMDDDMLVSVGSDAGHQVAAWDVSMQKLVCTSRGDVNPILAVDSPGQGSFVTVGVSHIKFWRYAEGSDLLAHGGIFGNKGHVQTMLCVKSFFVETRENPAAETHELPSDPDAAQNPEDLVTVTGTEDGSIYVWKNRMLWSNTRGAHKGPVFALCIPDEHPNLVLSGGKDGGIVIHLLDASEHGKGLTPLSVIDATKLEKPPRVISERHSIRALACCSAGPGWLRLAFGTCANDVMQVEIDVRNSRSISLLQHTLCAVVHGHAGSAVKALCAHPDFPEFATAGQEGMLRLWNATEHSLSACVQLGHAGSAVDYSLALNQHLAVGLAEGGVIILDASAVRQGLEHEACCVQRLADRRCEITDVKYSPDGQYLAVASFDNAIDIYKVKTSYTRWGVCRGHRDTIRHLDWATNSGVMRSNDTSQELLYWNVKQMRKGAIDSIVGSHDMNQVTWSRDSCPMTWASQGTCASYQFVSEIAAVDRSRNGALLAAADAFGRVRLFRFPSLEGGLNELFDAHPGPVTNVKFTFDDSFLLSTCSTDMCLLQWKVDLVPNSVDADVDEVLQAQTTPGLLPPGRGQEAQEEDLEMFKPFHAGVFAPTIVSAGKHLPWEPDASMYEMPEQELELETVHGCRGHDQHAHACFNARFHAVYYTAKIVVVQDREYGLQRFFLGHTEDVSCIAPHPHGRIFASGQTGTKGLICVWDSLRQQVRILHSGRQRSLRQMASFEAPSSQGIAAMSFSASGAHLVSVSQNLEHELTLWDWRNRVALSVVKGSMNKTLAITCNRFARASASGSTDSFITCGVKHVRFWDVVQGQLVCRNADLASRGVMSIQLSCTFSKEYAVTGNQEGHLYIWKDACLVKCVKDAHKGPVFALHTAAHTSEGNAVFCSAAGDGVVKLWTIKKRLVQNAKEVKNEEEVDAEPSERKVQQPVSDVEVHCFEPEGVHINKVIEGLNVPSIGQPLSVRAAYIQFEPSVKTISADGVWRILIATSINELYQLTLPQLISAPNERTTEVHRGQIERETVKVYNNVTYGNEGVGTEKLPAIQLLVQAHTPPHVAGSVGAQPSELTLDAASSIRALAVHPESENEFATCGADGLLRIWDNQQGRVRFMYRLGETVQSMCYSAVRDDCWHLALGCRGKIKIMEASTPLVFGDDITVLANLDKSKGVGTRDVVTCVKYSGSMNSRGNCYLAAGLSSGSIVVYEAPINGHENAYEVKAKFKGHSGPVLHLDFSKQSGGDAEHLQSNCSRFELRFWNIKQGKEVKAASEMRNEKWESLTCPLSWSALGMRPDDYQVVPCIDRSPDHPCLVGAIWPEKYKLLALSGLQGQVTLARDPFLERALVKSWPAHSMPPASVRFTFGAQSVISVGDADLSVCVWRRQLPVHKDLQRVLDVPCSMKAKPGEADALFLSKEHGSHAAAAGELLGAQAAFDDAKPFLTTTKMFKAGGWDNFHPDDLESAGRTELAKYELRLTHLHGSRGHCALNNVLYNQKGQAVYVAAQVAVVQEGNTQVQHFQAHDDDIMCIDISDDGKLAATGQVGEAGQACIWIWNAVNTEKVQRISYPRDGGVYALSFKPAQGRADVPEFLASVANDEDCTIDVWDLRGGINDCKLLVSIAGDKNRILSVRWNPFCSKDDDVFGSLVTMGDKHLQFWLFSQAVPSEDEQLDMDEGAGMGAVSLVRHKPVWKDTTKQTCLSVCFVEQTKADASDESTERGYTITGMQDGSVFFWKWLAEETGVVVIKVLPSLHDGPICTLLTTATGLLLSGGNDGLVKMWQLASFGEKGASVLRQIDMQSVGASGTHVSKVVRPGIRSLCANATADSELSLLVGTVSNEIYEMNISGGEDMTGALKSRPVVQGHGGEQVEGLAMHPEKNWYATVGHDGVVRVWNLEEKRCTYATLLKDDKGNTVGGKALCFRGKVDRPIGIEECPVCHYGTVEKERTFRCDELAVGTLCGQVIIFKMGQDGQLLECARVHQRKTAITCLQYAPTGTLLAVASEDMVLDVLLPDENHRRVGVCKGHMAPIVSIDWTTDGEFMQTSDTALELMFWSMKARTEKTVPEFAAYSKPILLYQKEWAGYTTPLGWPWHGIYTVGSEGVGLNAVDRCILDRQSKKALGVSANANGLLRLFPYPNQPDMAGMQAQSYEAHSAAVSKVRFSANGHFVVSVGGRDCTIIQWEVLAPTKEHAALDADAGQGKAAESDDDDSDGELDRLYAANKPNADQHYNEKGRNM